MVTSFTEIKHETDIDKLKKCFEYDPETGAVYSKRLKRIVGGRQNGYLVVRYGGRRILCHRLAWAFTYNEWPKWPNVINHKNGKRDDNRLKNLEVVPHWINLMRRVNIAPQNSTGVTGVCPCKQTGKFKATVVVQGKQKWLGRFDTIEEAAAARKAAEDELQIWE